VFLHVSVDASNVFSRESLTRAIMRIRFRNFFFSHSPSQILSFLVYFGKDTYENLKEMLDRAMDELMAIMRAGFKMECPDPSLKTPNGMIDIVFYEWLMVGGDKPGVCGLLGMGCSGSDAGCTVCVASRKAGEWDLTRACEIPLSMYRTFEHACALAHCNPLDKFAPWTCPAPGCRKEFKCQQDVDDDVVLVGVAQNKKHRDGHYNQNHKQPPLVICWDRDHDRVKARVMEQLGGELPDGKSFLDVILENPKYGTLIAKQAVLCILHLALRETARMFKLTIVARLTSQEQLHALLVAFKALGVSTPPNFKTQTVGKDNPVCPSFNGDHCDKVLADMRLGDGVDGENGSTILNAVKLERRDHNQAVELWAVAGNLIELIVDTRTPDTVEGRLDKSERVKAVAATYVYTYNRYLPIEKSIHMSVYMHEIKCHLHLYFLWVSTNISQLSGQGLEHVNKLGKEAMKLTNRKRLLAVVGGVTKQRQRTGCVAQGLSRLLGKTQSNGAAQWRHGLHKKRQILVLTE